MVRLDTNVIYLNARVRGMKSRLFSRAAINDMLDYDEVKRVVEVLLESPYRAEMAEALTRHEGADAVEEALSRKLSATRQKLIEIAEGKFEDLVRLFFLRSDLRVVKSMLRCRHQGIEGQAAMAYLIPGPTLTPPLQEELAQNGSMEALLNGLVAWNPGLCSCLLPAFHEYEEAHDLPILEEALDRDYFVENAHRLGTAKDTDSQALRTLLQTEIDRINLRSLFQVLDEDSDREALRERLLPEGRLNIRFLRRVAAAEDVAGAMELLGSTPYRILIEELFQFMQTHRFAPIERRLEGVMIKELRRKARVDVIGLAVVMEYGWLKRNEILNLRLVARGLAGHLPTGRVREELHLV